MTKKILQSIWPALIWSVIIFILLIIPGKDLPRAPEIPLLDKVIHSFLFGMLVFIWCSYYGYRLPSQAVGIFFLVFIISCIYGIGMEFIQKYFVANRGFEWGDIVADVVGSFAGWQGCRLSFSKKQDGL
ncbi:MAG TPA: VanZ family protein [Agriterribacter sp.]|nr:VanZ family protein [Agriterribacter sp.]